MDKSEIKILVVDDSEFSRKTISDILSDEGYNVVGDAGSAEDAINVLSKTPCQILILDVVMPDISGIELATKLLETVKDMYIIMISSLAQEQVIIESISAGATDFIQKPFSREQLISSVEKTASLMTDEQG